MEDYIWLFDRREYGELTKSVLGSVLFHALLFAILISTPIFHPLPGDSDRIDVLWYYPALSAGRPAETPEKAAAGRHEAVATKGIVTPPANPPVKAEQQVAAAKTVVHEPVAMPPAPSSPSRKSEAVVQPLVEAPPEEEAEPETEPEMVIPAAIEPQQPIKPESNPAQESPAKIAAASERKIESAPKSEAPPAALDKLSIPASKVADNQTAATPAAKETVRSSEDVTAAKPAVTGNPQAPVRSAESPFRQMQPGATAATTKPVYAVTNAPSSSPATATSPGPSSSVRPASQPAGVPGKAIVQASGKETVPVPAPRTVPSAKKAEGSSTDAKARRIALPPLRGDLKLEIVGEDDLLQQIKVTALFRDYPRARRNRPLTLSESQHSRTMSPILIRSGEKARQAVIEIAGEGVYEFVVETGSTQPVDVVFAVKLYDPGSKSQTKPLGTRQIIQKESIVKVLMPEGILWSEDAAFSGSLEDSNSVTKFNSDSGLLWKEYK
ncbi:MAG TPA: hypothetical protein VMJ66_15815 [Geobacteraceae bacterium]|nr:hypothetical protein [Geobacteraceae bacterium]